MTDEPRMGPRDFAAQADDATLVYFRKQFADIMSLSRMSTCSKEINEIAGALAKAQAEFKTPVKNVPVNFSGRSYKYADLESVYKAIRKPLADNGLAITHLCQEFAGQVELVTMLMHSSGQWFRSVYPVKAKVDRPQEFGSAMTYAKRYSVSALLGIASEEDDDAQSAQEASRAAGSDSEQRAAIGRLNARHEASQQPTGPDLAIMDPETGEFVETFKRSSKNAQAYMAKLAELCSHSSLYWRVNRQQAVGIAEKLPQLLIDDEPISRMIERLDGQFGMPEPEDPRDDPAKVMIP